MPEFAELRAELDAISPVRRFGRIAQITRGCLQVNGLTDILRLGDRVAISGAASGAIGGEVLGLARDHVTILPDGNCDGVKIGDRVESRGTSTIRPHDAWLGRVVDAFGVALDGQPLPQGSRPRELRTPAPDAARRKMLGPRLETGNAVFNTLLPLVQGQRVGLFAGSGVGKTSLLGDLVRGIASDVVVIALIGERSRELREFTENILGTDGMGRTVVVAATSDRSALERRRAAFAAMAVAEHFRNQGAQVLLLADSITRFAEAHREIALAAGEPAVLRGYPPSLVQQIAGLAERAGPGLEGAGDITAIFSVLVAGSDMDEPIADILRGILDGHVVLDREIAERGRFPAIDLLASVSRSLPGAASAEENRLIAEARRLLGAYARAELMVRAGLYTAGSDAETDMAIAVWPALDAFMARPGPEDTKTSFQALARALKPRLKGQRPA